MRSTDGASSAPGNTNRPGVAAGPVSTRIPNQRNRYARPVPSGPGDGGNDVAWLRDLARRGELGPAIAAGQGARLSRAAFAVSYQIVFDVVTRRLELSNRGHTWCVPFMDGACLDGYYDDVEALIDYLLACTKPIEDLEGWLAHWAPKAAIDGHRRRRGERGALQRPRMTRALATDLNDDPWLSELALKILVWVGLPTGAGAELWPLDRWAQMRAERTGDHAGSTPARVAADVERVLAAMRRRPQWYEDFVERPLGRKVAPLAAPPGDGVTDPRPLVTVTPEEIEDRRISELAWTAVEAIRIGLDHHHDPTETVIEVLTRLFLGGAGSDEFDRTPSAGDDQRHRRLSALLDDPVALTGIVDRVLGIVRGEPQR
ncbi:hypothetical protein [Actinoplanes regularis]|uniref:Uncharacterized protein n=1 Tax=Actinoplanes regularis TaxID=52697 RepID=A0A238YP15_9ACTN|nr:hypothetical protein [Actinoplanes regularis]GIE85421.1 hypothetical protein Are01nite_19010 [Actinoplanes regularis]SNR72548.1 hypothetical protein SAMN06264365_10542 [Actinoplanes regularis]